MKKMDVRVRRTYKQLSDALLRLLAKKSFDEITVLEICSEAEVHRATFYKHFVDKFDFLNLCFQMKLSELNLTEPNEKYTTETLKKSLNDMLIEVVHFAEENREFISYLSIDKYSASFVNTLNEAIAKFITNRIYTSKELATSLGVQVPMIAYYYAGAISGLLKWWARTEEPCTAKEFIDFAQIKINDICNYFNLYV